MLPGFIEYAPEYIQKLAAEVAPKATAFVMFEIFFSTGVDPILRDRTEELTGAVAGVASLRGTPKVVVFTGTGKEYAKFGYEPVVTGWATTQRVIFA